MKQTLSRPPNNWNHALIKLFGHPSIVLIGGIWKSGKTDFALFISECLIKLGLITEVASNIDTQGHYQQIYDLISIKRWLYSSKKNKLYIFDEASEHLMSRHSMTGRNVGFIQLIPEISKAHGRLIIIGHQLQTIDKQLLDEVWCRGIFIKLGLKNAQLTSHLLSQEFHFNNIPPTSVPFDPYTIAPFQEKPDGAIVFKDADKQLVWDWANGKTYKELGIHNMTLNRKIRSYLKAILENEIHVTHT